MKANKPNKVEYIFPKYNEDGKEDDNLKIKPAFTARQKLMKTIKEEQYEHDEFEAFHIDPLEQVIPTNDNNMAVYFNIASLFRS